MEPSSSSSPAGPAKKTPVAAWLDRAALAGLGVGFALYMLPLGDWALRWGFFITLLFTIFHIFTSHLDKGDA